jgi:hypothetical protein
MQRRSGTASAVKVEEEWDDLFLGRGNEGRADSGDGVNPAAAAVTASKSKSSSYGLRTGRL